MLTNGGPRAAIDCLRLYPANMDVTYAAFKVLRGLLGNPSTMMKLRKQKRFRIIPAAVIDGVYRHDSLDVRAEAAHCLWTYSGVGGVDAQDLVVGVDFLPVLKSGLEEARAMDKGRSDARVRKFVGCTLALAKGNEPVQDLLVAEGMRALLRKSLVEFKTITFNGEFTELRDWLRGERGGGGVTGGRGGGGCGDEGRRRGRDRGVSEHGAVGRRARSGSIVSVSVPGGRRRGRRIVARGVRARFRREDRGEGAEEGRGRGGGWGRGLGVVRFRLELVAKRWDVKARVVVVLKRNVTMGVSTSATSITPGACAMAW